MAGQITRTSGIGTASWSSSNTEIDALDGIVMLAGAVSERASVLVVNDGDSTGDLYVTAQNGSKRSGFRLLPGAGLELRTTAQVFAYVKTGRVTASIIETSGVVCS